MDAFTRRRNRYYARPSYVDLLLLSLMHSNNRSKNTKAFAYLNVATITLFFPKHDKWVVRCRYKLFSWFIENLKKNRLKMFKC